MEFEIGLSFPVAVDMYMSLYWDNFLISCLSSLTTVVKFTSMFLFLRRILTEFRVQT